MLINFLMALAIAAFIIGIINLVQWSTYGQTNEYYYNRCKNGRWAIFWLAIAIGITWKFGG